MELERPSASYTVDVRYPPVQNSEGLMLTVDLFPDASPCGTNPLTCRHNSGTAPSSIDRQVKKAYYGCKVDTRGEKIVDGWSHGRIHALEWHSI